MLTVPWSGRALAGLLLLGLAFGCSKAKPALSPVHGTVSYRGSPLSTGSVVFTPDPSRGHDGALARGDIQPDGTYSLRTDAAYGVAPGWYRVTVLAVEMPAHAPEGQAFPMPLSLIPERYRDPELAGLVREVNAGGDNRIDLDLD
jgi:hypothetical protein